MPPIASNSLRQASSRRDDLNQQIRRHLFDDEILHRRHGADWWLLVHNWPNAIGTGLPPGELTTSLYHRAWSQRRQVPTLLLCSAARYFFAAAEVIQFHRRHATPLLVSPSILFEAVDMGDRGIVSGLQAIPTSRILLGCYTVATPSDMPEDGVTIVGTHVRRGACRYCVR